MDTFQPVVAFNGQRMSISSAKALIKDYDRELSEVEALITRVEDDKREDERDFRSSKEAVLLQLPHQIDDLRTQELVEVKQLEATFHARRAPLHLDEKRKSILAKINEIKASIVPVQTVPAEVLGYIFREVVALDVAPWLLTTVNNSWRTTALTDPRLWSNIRLGWVDQEFGRIGLQSKWLVDGISRTCCGNRLIIQNLDELAYFVDKSGVVPLDVQVYWKVEEDGWEVLRRLFGPRLSSRIGSLSMASQVEPMWDTNWILGPLPLLQKLSCCSNQGPFIGRVMAQAHHLKDSKITSLTRDMLQWPFWKTLCVLNLEHHAHASELNRLISELPLIEVIKGNTIDWPNISTPVVTLPHIKSIELTCDLPYIARLRLPQLEKLVWFDHNFPYDFDGHLDFPAEPEWTLSFSHLVEIEVGAPGEAFAVALRELPNVRTALLRPNHSKDPKDSWVMDLIQSLIGAEDMLCPKLRHLTVKRLKANKALAEPLIRQLITSRQASGTPIRHLTIVWARRSGKGEEVVQYAF